MSLVFLAVNGQTKVVSFAGYGQPNFMTNPNLFLTTLDDTTTGVKDLLSNVSSHTYDYVMGTNPYLLAYFDGSNLQISAINASPTSGTVSFLGQTDTFTFTAGSATFPFSVHPSVAAQRVTVSVLVTGFPLIYVECGGMGANVQLQKYKDSSGVTHVIPYHNINLAEYYAANTSFNPAWQPPDIATALGILMEIGTKVLSAMQNTTYTPITLTANQQNALMDLLNNIVPNAPTSLETAVPVPASGAAQTYNSHYDSYRSHFALSGTAMSNYETARAAIEQYVPLN